MWSFLGGRGEGEDEGGLEMISFDLQDSQNLNDLNIWISISYPLPASEKKKYHSTHPASNVIRSTNLPENLPANIPSMGKTNLELFEGIFFALGSSKNEENPGGFIYPLVN